MSVRVPSRSLAALTAVALVSSISQVLAPVAEAAPVATVDQGDLIYNEATGQECAVGWLHRGYAFTAGQCGADGDTFREFTAPRIATGEEHQLIQSFIGNPNLALA